MATVSTIPRQARAHAKMIGQVLTVALPGELTRAQVTEVINDDEIKAKIVQTPMAKSHLYQVGQELRFRRVATPVGEKWEVT